MDNQQKMGTELSLQQRLNRLATNATTGERLASFWQKAIDEHGEEKATEFYTHLVEMNSCESCEVLKADLARETQELQRELQQAEREIQLKEHQILVGEAVLLLLDREKEAADR